MRKKRRSMPLGKVAQGWGLAIRDHGALPSFDLRCPRILKNSQVSVAREFTSRKIIFFKTIIYKF